MKINIVKIVSFIIWVLCIVVFTIGQIVAPSNYSTMPGNPFGNVFGTTVILGVVSFLVMLVAIILEHDKTKRHKTKKPKVKNKLEKYVFSVGIAIILLLFTVVAVKSNFQNSKHNSINLPSIPPITTPSPTPTPTIDPDPIITCNINASCGGGSQQLRRSVCNNMTCCLYDSKCGGPKFVSKSKCGTNITCCGLSDGTWTLMDNDACNKVHNASNSTSGPPKTQQSTTNNVYCWNNAYGYSYYTSSGDQCNLDNLKSTSYKICMDSQKSKSDSCSSICKSELSSNNSACAWAYTGPNAGIEQNSDLYGECLNGTGGTSDIYGVCLQKCSDQYAQDIKQCTY